MGILIKGGTLADPAGGFQGKGDILIENGRIAAVGDIRTAAEQTIDAAGDIVCPGFIDIHMHEDPVNGGRIYDDPEKSVQMCMLRMGVTTAIGGNCGDNVCDPGDYLDLVDRDGAAVNLGLFAGQSYYRCQAGAKDKYGPADPEQIAREAEMIARALERGCLGVSFGIRYVPGVTEAELLAAAAPCTRSGKPLAAHLRDDAEAVFSAAEEFFAVGRALRLPMQVSHIGSMAGFGQMREFLEMIEERRRQGLDVRCDCYPYSAFSTDLGSTTYDDGWLERYRCGYGVLELAEGKYKGQRCTERIFREERRDNPGCKTVCHVMRDGDVELALLHPLVMVASDATFDQGQGHPRAAGTFPRIFRDYVAQGKLTMMQAVEKMSTAPAERLGLKEKGRLSPGADADITVLDPARIADRATFSEPTAHPEGIRHVLIGGRAAVLEGAVINAKRGRAVRT